MRLREKLDHLLKCYLGLQLRFHLNLSSKENLCQFRIIELVNQRCFK